jgi:hypothetical protein
VIALSKPQFAQPQPNPLIESYKSSPDDSLPPELFFKQAESSPKDLLLMFYSGSLKTGPKILQFRMCQKFQLKNIKNFFCIPIAHLPNFKIFRLDFEEMQSILWAVVFLGT